DVVPGLRNVERHVLSHGDVLGVLPCASTGLQHPPGTFPALIRLEPGHDMRKRLADTSHVQPGLRPMTIRVSGNNQCDGLLLKGARLKLCIGKPCLRISVDSVHTECVAMWPLSVAGS